MQGRWSLEAASQGGTRGLGPSRWDPASLETAGLWGPCPLPRQAEPLGALRTGSFGALHPASLQPDVSRTRSTSVQGFSVVLCLARFGSLGKGLQVLLAGGRFPGPHPILCRCCKCISECGTFTDQKTCPDCSHTRGPLHLLI